MNKRIVQDPDDELQLPEGTMIGEALSFEYDEAETKKIYPKTRNDDVLWGGFLDGYLREYRPADHEITVEFIIERRKNETSRIDLRFGRDLTFSACIRDVRKSNTPIAKLELLHRLGK